MVRAERLRARAGPLTAAEGQPSAGPTVYLAAMAFEARALLRRVEGAARVQDDGGVTAVRGRLRDRPVEVVVCGVGARAAVLAAERCVRLASRGSCGRVVWIGIAGALSPDLDIGDLIAARTAMSPGRPPLDLDEALAAAASERGCRPGVLVTASGLVATASSREALWRRSGQRDATAVDMESWPAARVLQSAGVPFAAVRAISDTAADRLPPWLERLPAPAGGDLPGLLLRRALAQPSSLLPLTKIRLRATRLTARLADPAAALA